MKTPVLAILQNMWVKDPERLKRMFTYHGEEFRLAMMRRLLFAGSKTGRNLKKAFGDDLLAKITFEETTREIAGDPKTIYPADLQHLAICLERHRPEVVLTFGKIAEDAWRKTRCDFDRPLHLAAHHPASRHPSSWQTLTEAAAKLREYLG